jgi:hypothetical protein
MYLEDMARFSSWRAQLGHLLMLFQRQSLYFQTTWIVDEDLRNETVTLELMFSKITWISHTQCINVNSAWERETSSFRMAANGGSSRRVLR